jgi:C1A family cysteine protease
MGKKLPYKYNLKKSKDRDTDLLFHDFFQKLQPVPSSADLRNGYRSIKDQGKLGACTAFSAVSVMEYLVSKNADLSELYFYYQERAEDGDIAEDEGSTISRSATVATTVGTCLENLDPYVVADFANTPGSKADTDAPNHKVKTKYKITTIEDILYSVGVLKKPVLIGIDVYESFENIGSDGYVPMPNQDEELLGGHALNICGYFYKNEGILQDVLENVEEKIAKLLLKKKYNGLYFIVRNSWSESFGDKGYIYMPVEFLQKYSSDWWHIDLK